MLPDGHEGIDTTEPMPIDALEPLDPARAADGTRTNLPSANASWLAKLDAVAAERAALVPLPRPVSRPRASLPPPHRTATGTFTALKAAPPAIPAAPASIAPPPVEMTSPLELDELEPVNMTAPLELDELEPVEASVPIVFDATPKPAPSQFPIVPNVLMFEATPTPLPAPVVLEDSLPFAPLRLDESAPVGLTARFDRSSTYVAPITARAIPVRVIAAAVVGIAVVAVAVVAIRGSSSSHATPAAPVATSVATVERTPVVAPPPHVVASPPPVVAPPAPIVEPPPVVEPIAKPAPTVVEPKPIAKPRASVWAKAAAAPAPAPKRVATATAKTGTLMISTKPPCAIVVDGKPTRLMTPQRALALPVGNHTLTFVDAQKKVRGKLAVHVEPLRTTKIIRDFMH